MSLYIDLAPKSKYIESKFKYLDPKTKKEREEEYRQKLSVSTTFYVGNLSFYTTEEQIWELFSKCGEIRRIIMGLNRNTKTPCGFCFVDYYIHDSAASAMKWLTGTRLDDRLIRLDWAEEASDEFRYGRGKSGGQVRDEYRNDFDPGRTFSSKHEDDKKEREED